MHTITKRDVSSLFPPRPDWSHKGQAGKLLVIGGSWRYSGSPAFVALAAIRSGADLTLVAAPKRAADIIAGMQPDLITEPLHCDHLCVHETRHLTGLIKWADAIVIGGGLDRKKTTYKTIRALLRKTEKPCVLDAEALRAVAGYPSLLRRNFILTPHENEFEALGGGRPRRSIRERSNQVKGLSGRLKTTILLKGSVDVISDGKNTALNRTGSPYMTKGGTGDALAGICGALLARGKGPFESAGTAAWINGSAGQLASRKIGPGFFVSEMLDFIPKVIWG